jgi:hypothetical protein
MCSRLAAPRVLGNSATLILARDFANGNALDLGIVLLPFASLTTTHLVVVWLRHMLFVWAITLQIRAQL